MAVMLCADDYALAEGVSCAIEELAAARCLSATSALVTTRHWPVHGRRVPDLMQHVQVGLHLNLTLGRPLTLMPRLAPDGRLPPIGTLVRLALTGRIDADEIRREVSAQIAVFTETAGVAPDFVDGHQHAHALPTIRAAVVDALIAAFPGRTPWVRDPADGLAAIAKRRAEVPKALTLACLTAGFGATLRRNGFRANSGFAGVSSFSRSEAYHRELERFFRSPGPQHLIMCHPGHVDPELATLDPVVERRADEYTALIGHRGLSGLIVTDGACWWGARGPYDEPR